MAKGSAWTKFATDFYHKKKAEDSTYKFKNALKDAAKEYKGGSQLLEEQKGGTEDKPQGLLQGGKRRNRSRSRRSRKNKSQKRKSRRNNKK